MGIRARGQGQGQSDPFVTVDLFNTEETQWTLIPRIPLCPEIQPQQEQGAGPRLRPEVDYSLLKPVLLLDVDPLWNIFGKHRDLNGFDDDRVPTMHHLQGGGGIVSSAKNVLFYILYGSVVQGEVNDVDVKAKAKLILKLRIDAVGEEAEFITHWAKVFPPTERRIGPLATLRNSCLNCEGPGPGPLHTPQQCFVDLLDPDYDQDSPTEVEESSPGL
ncbi:hypothetical protein JEQ12_000205 [Ovis aries]|uniref:Uncharacterized protein n=1 Tax=Ovis aries TaxID=9940 RepID=A0A836ACM4_SHEEP|nr:hypothetical protein JEQ12_000205 [Ovis aries]